MLFGIIKNKPRLFVPMEENVLSVVLSVVYSKKLRGSLTFHSTPFSNFGDFYHENGLFL